MYICRFSQYCTLTDDLAHPDQTVRRGVSRMAVGRAGRRGRHGTARPIYFGFIVIIDRRERWCRTECTTRWTEQYKQLESTVILKSRGLYILHDVSLSGSPRAVPNHSQTVRHARFPVSVSPKTPQRRSTNTSHKSTPPAAWDTAPPNLSPP